MNNFVARIAGVTFPVVVMLGSLVACGGSSGGGPDTNNTVPPGGNGNGAINSAPKLTPIAGKNAVTSKTLRLELSGTDIDGDQLIFSADGTAGTSNNPFMQSTPAIFDQVNGIFEWTPTGLEIGQYSVEFTVTENTLQALSASVVVDITVDTLGSYGQQLYTSSCATCHGIDGTGISGPDIRLKTTADITNALINVASMQPLANQLDQDSTEAIAYHVLTKFSGTDFHSQFNLSNGCVACHDGFESIGQPATHISTTDVCQACHSAGGNFNPVASVDHNQVIGICASCHDSVIAQGKIVGHIDTNNNCEACHNTVKFDPAATVNHTAVIGACFDCHDGTTAIGKSGMHISTNNNCSACHTTIVFNLNKTVAHQNAFGFCADCHNNVTAIGKQAGHPGTSFDCSDCHDTNVF